MTQAMRQVVRVKPGGIIEICAPQLTPGAVAEVIVLTEDAGAQGGVDRAGELDALFKSSQALPQARAITEEEIAAEIADYRASQPTP